MKMKIAGFLIKLPIPNLKTKNDNSKTKEKIKKLMILFSKFKSLIIPANIAAEKNKEIAKFIKKAILELFNRSIELGP